MPLYFCPACPIIDLLQKNRDLHKMDYNSNRTMKTNYDRFGINMKKWCHDHETVVYEAIARGQVTDELIKKHRDKLVWLQHERLVHLIVTVMTVLCEMFLLDLVLLHPDLGLGPTIAMLGFAVLLGFYFYHYFFLENTVQRWYKIADEMSRKS